MCIYISYVSYMHIYHIISYHIISCHIYIYIIYIYHIYIYHIYIPYIYIIYTYMSHIYIYHIHIQYIYISYIYIFIYYIGIGQNCSFLWGRPGLADAQNATGRSRVEKILAPVSQDATQEVGSLLAITLDNIYRYLYIDIYIYI